MQRFLKDTIQSRFVKSILQDTYIPRYPSVIEGDYIVEGIMYLFASMIILCIHSGVLGDDGRYQYIDNYNRDKIDLTIQGNFVSKESFYDSETHVKLGDYLRYYRGQTGIDLMPLYNCYNNLYNNNYTLKTTGISTASSDLVKVLQVPIKFNKTYTIAIDCSSNVIMCPAFIIDGDYVFSGDTNLTDILYTDNNPTKFFSSMNFLTPETYRIDNDNTVLQRYEYCLNLLIQIPYNCDSSIVVLEGDYTESDYKNVISLENTDDYYGLDSISQNEQNKLFVSGLSLLEVNDRVSYAFSRNLILYLLQSAITSNEDIYHNIERVQIGLDVMLYYKAVRDVWSDNIRKIIYDKYFDKVKDLLGYVDAGVEDLIAKGN